MSIGANIKKRRYELKMSQQELADIIGYKTRSTIAKIESGVNDISQKKLARFADALDTTAEALITGNLSYSDVATHSPPSLSTASSLHFPHRTVAIILAGGKSSRNRQNIPNQFINIMGKPVIVYCMEAYQAHPSIDDIYVVCLKGWEQIVTAYAQQFHITKLRDLIHAGQSGILSVSNALSHINNKYSQSDIVIFQESTRPMVDVDTISKLLQSVYENGFANICYPMKDILQFTIKNDTASVVDRESVVDVQSPEAYRLQVIRNVFNEAVKQQHPLTESCCALLMYNLGFPIKFIDGSATNYKILRQEDIAIVTATLQA